MMTASERCKARIFGTCSPSVMCRKVIITIARSEATACAVADGPAPVSPGGSWPKRPKTRSSPGWTSSANVCSPNQPRIRLAMVTPSCVAEMKSVGLFFARWIMRAARLPVAASWSMRVEREETRANSVATKKPFAATSSRTTMTPTRRDIADSVAQSMGYVGLPTRSRLPFQPLPGFARRPQAHEPRVRAQSPRPRTLERAVVQSVELDERDAVASGKLGGKRRLARATSAFDVDARRHFAFLRERAELHRAQAADALFDRRVCAEQVAERHALERIDDEQRRDGWIDLQRAHTRGHLELLQCAGQRIRIAVDARARLVRAVLTRARDGEVNDRRGDRRENDHEQGGERVHAIVIVRATEAAEDERPLRHVGEQRDRTGDGRRDARNQDVVVADMPELVRQHTGQLIARQDAHDARRDGDHRVSGVTSGGERAGRRAIDDGHPRLGQARVRRQLLDELVQLRCLFLADLARTGHAQRDVA